MYGLCTYYRRYRRRISAISPTLTFLKNYPPNLHTQTRTRTRNTSAAHAASHLDITPPSRAPAECSLHFVRQRTPSRPPGQRAPTALAPAPDDGGRGPGSTKAETTTQRSCGGRRRAFPQHDGSAAAPSAPGPQAAGRSGSRHRPRARRGSRALRRRSPRLPGRSEAARPCSCAAQQLRGRQRRPGIARARRACPGTAVP